MSWITRPVRALELSASLALPFALGAAPVGLAAQQKPLSYTIRFRGEGQTPASVIVTQGRTGALARPVVEGTPRDAPSLITRAGASAGRPLRVRDRMRLLAEVYAGAERLEPGRVLRDGTRVDSIAVELAPGPRDSVLDGRATKHYALRVVLVVTGGPNRVTQTGQADLWFAPELPFSWLPLTVSDRLPGYALPLMSTDRAVPAHLLETVGDRLAGLGLLLRAEISERYAYANAETGESSGSTDLARAVWLEQLTAGAKEPDLEAYRELPVLTPGRVEALEMGMMAYWESCLSHLSASSGSATLEVGTERSVAKGSAVFDASGFSEGDASAFYLGSSGERVQCAVVIATGNPPAPGTQAIVALEAGRAPPEKTAWMFYFLADPGRQVIEAAGVVEQGTLSVEVASGGLKGRVQGRGWLVGLDPERPSRLEEGVSMAASFSAALP